MSARHGYVITIMSRDRVGIVADVTGALLALGGNVDAMSQTVMSGYFTIIITASFPESVTPSRLVEAVEEAGDEGELAVSVKPWTPADAQQVVGGACDRFVLSIMGADKPGIIAKISGFLSSRNINIEDLYAYVEDGRFVLISQVMVPRAMDVGQLQIDLENLWKKSGMVAYFQHENIFLATNRVDFRGGA